LLRHLHLEHDGRFEVNLLGNGGCPQFSLTGDLES
jgi:hypothetical protein